MASVAFECVGKTYPNGFRALTDFSLRVEERELLVLVGPSGCGKSTLLRLLAGLEQADSGTIRIGGRIVNDLSPQQRNIAMVFQDYALYPTMSVRGNLEFPLKMRKLDRAERLRRIAGAAELLDLNEVLDRLPKQLSGGQRQRVAMGRALVREPTVFLLDEPLSNLDAKLRGQVRTEIVDLQRRTGTTMIYVTHDQVEAMTMGHRIAVLSAGKLQQVATPKVLYERPANTFVAGFIGTPAMNFLPENLLRRLERAMSHHLHRCRIAWPFGGASAATAGPRTSTLIAGVRPENLSIVETGAGYPAVIVELEYLGHETLIRFRFADREANTSFVLRLDGAPALRVGQGIHVAIRSGGVIWFDEQGLALELSPPSSSSLSP